MKRSNRLVLVLGHLMAVVAFGAIPAVGAPRGTAARAPVQRVAVVTAAEDLGLGMLVATEHLATIQMPIDDAVDTLAERDESFPVALDDITTSTTVKVLVQNVQALATTMPQAASPDGPADPDTGPPLIDERLVILGVSPQQAELIRFAQLDDNLSLLLRSPQDAASADVTTTGVTQRPLVDEHGVLPPRVVISQFPEHPSWDRARLTGARA